MSRCLLSGQSSEPNCQLLSEPFFLRCSFSVYFLYFYYNVNFHLHYIHFSLPWITCFSQHLFHTSLMVLEFTLKVYTVWRVMLCLLLTLSVKCVRWIIYYKAEAKRDQKLWFCARFIKTMNQSKYLEELLFLENPLNSLMPAGCRRFFSSHCVYRCLCVCWVCCTVSMFDIMRMEWPVMRLMFLMSELQINRFVLSRGCFFSDGTALVSFREHNTHFKRDTHDTKCHSA